MRPLRRRNVVAPSLLLAAGAALTLVALTLPSVATSLMVVNPMGGTIAAKCGVGKFPSFPAYDPVSHVMYVPNQGSGNISVVAAPCTVKSTIALPSGALPIAAAFSPANDYIYVIDNNLNQVYVISGTTIVATINGGHFNTPNAITWDPGDSVMLVANFGWSNLSAVYGTAYTGTINVGSQPTAICYDPYYNTILVQNFGSLNITIISSATFPFTSAHSSTLYGGGEEDIIFNPANNLDYIADYSFPNITVIDGLGGFVGNIPVGKGPLWEAFDQATLTVFVGNAGSHSVWSVSGFTVVKKYNLGTGAVPFGVTYSDFTDKVYVASSSTGAYFELN